MTAIARRQATEARLRRVEGQHNAMVRELRRAFARGEANSEGYFAIEGWRIMEEAIRSGVRFRTVFFSESAAGKAQRLLNQLGAQVETLILPDRLFASAVPSQAPQGVAALVRGKEYSLEDVLARAGVGPLVVVTGVQDPGNLGTIVRSAEAFGAGGMVLGEGTVSALNPKAVRASAGSIFRLPLARTNLLGALPTMKERGVRLVATSSHRGTPLRKANLTEPLAVLIGSEGAGVPRELLAKMDELIVVPHSEKVESLNAGVAASIVLYEMARQRS